MTKATNGVDTDFMLPNFAQLYADYARMFGDFGKFFGGSKSPLLNVEAVMASQRKTIEALTKANRVAFEGAQAAARRQAELVRQGLDDLAKMNRELAAAGSPEEKLVRQAEIAKESLTAALGALRELTETLQKSNTEAVEVIGRRLSDNFDEVKAVLKQANGRA